MCLVSERKQRWRLSRQRLHPNLSSSLLTRKSFEVSVRFIHVFLSKMSKVPAALNPTEEDISLLLAAQTHIGTKNADKQMALYVYTRCADGIHLLNVGKTWEKIVLAVHVLVAIENPAETMLSSAVNTVSATCSSSLLGPCHHHRCRFTLDSFTNHSTHLFRIVVTET